MESWLKFFGGLVLLVLGVWRLSTMIRERKEGYEDRYGNHIGIYFGAIGCIIIGLVFIWQGVF